jgi:putative hydrolase of the HAD superfamily
MTTAILADLDDTLFDDRHAMSCAISALHLSHGVGDAISGPVLTEHWTAITELHWARYRSGELTFQEQRRERVRDLLQRPVSSSEADALFEQYLAHYRAHWRLAPGASEFLARTAHLPKVLISNGEHLQVNSKASALGLLEHFNAIVTPEVAGAVKPDLAIFRHALGVLGIADASACLMVGDNYDADIRPAQVLGMATFHVCNRTPGRRIADAANAAANFALLRGGSRPETCAPGPPIPCTLTPSLPEAPHP